MTAACARAAFRGEDPLAAVPERIRSRIAIDDETGCWVWTGALNSSGYASSTVPGSGTNLVHRGLWMVLVGPIENGLQLDHLCRVRHCVNPEHLELVSRRENQLRGAKGALKTHCAQGHPYTPENVIWRKPPSRHPRRICGICYEINKEKHAAKRRAEAAARRLERAA